MVVNSIMQLLYRRAVSWVRGARAADSSRTRAPGAGAGGRADAVSLSERARHLNAGGDPNRDCAPAADGPSCPCYAPGPARTPGERGVRAHGVPPDHRSSRAGGVAGAAQAGPAADDDAGDVAPAAAEVASPGPNPAGSDEALHGDLDGDGVVNESDLAYMKSVFFTGDEKADLNRDGVVNFADLTILKSNFSPVGIEEVPGDVDGDGAVDGKDLTYMRSVFFTADDKADLNGDGVVNFQDLGVLKSHLPPTDEA